MFSLYKDDSEDALIKEIKKLDSIFKEHIFI